MATGIVEEGQGYWEHGAGAVQIGWGTKGATRRCHALVMAHAGMSSEQAWGYCAERHHAVLGTWPGQGKKGKRMADVPVRHDGDHPGTLDLPDDWADSADDLPDLSSCTVAMLEKADATAAGGD